ncbi:MAG TPA: flagellar biosynthesis protein FlhB [Nitrospira sp.]|jgi:flagellar biosynthetic protein FlhB|nr:flagellar biosynthesis protein FlhB [Nitrospira sp.]
MAEDRSNKTEPATPKRKEEARKKGQIAVSRDVSTAVILLSGIGLLAAMLPVGLLKMTEMTRRGLTLSFPLDFYEKMTITQVYTIVIQAGITVVTLSLPVVAGILVMGSGASLLQTGLLWRANAVQPDVERINPIKGLSRLFSLRSVMELVKGLFKIAIVTGVGLWVARYDLLQIPALIGFDMGTVLQVTGQLSLKVALAVAGAITVLAALDYFYQRYEWERSLRMSKEEVKEEHKATEGDPLIKSRVRTIQREMTKKRMMAAVKTADVVITNPTHLAVALKYDTTTMGAPVVVAKGAGLIAERIRELARHHGVPVVEHKFVARTIFRLVDIGKEIPSELYRAVAEILAFVYRARGVTP